MGALREPRACASGGPGATGLVALWLVCALGFGSFGCARVLTSTKDDDQYLRTVTRDTPPRGRPSVATLWHFDGPRLVVQVDRWRTCHRVQRRVYHRRRVTTRSIAKDQRGLYLGIGLVAAVMGGAGFASPDTFATEGGVNEDGTEREPTTPQEIRTVGGLLLAAGVFTMAAALVDTLRSRDSVEDLGEVQMGTGRREPFACKEDRGEGLTPRLVLPGGGELEAVPRTDGTFVFELADIEAAVATGQGHTARLAVGASEEHVSLLMSAAYRGRLLERERLLP